MKRILRHAAILLAFVMVLGAIPVPGAFGDMHRTTVMAKTKPVKISKKTAKLYVGDTLKLKVSGTKKKVKWSSSSKGVASVSKKGKIKAKKAGKATIKAKVGKKILKCKVTVRNKQPESESEASEDPGTSEGKDDKSDEIYEKIVAMKKKYPEGHSWTNSDFYAWKGGIYSGGYGCAGFAFMLSDAAFGSKKAKKSNDYENLKVGDVLHINNGSHWVIVLKVKSDSIIVAEGNYNKSVHWGREIRKSEIRSGCVERLTRY